MPAKNEWGLTPQQEKFALEVAKGVNLAEAYRIKRHLMKAVHGIDILEIRS